MTVIVSDVSKIPSAMRDCQTISAVFRLRRSQTLMQKCVRLKKLASAASSRAEDQMKCQAVFMKVSDAENEPSTSPSSRALGLGFSVLCLGVFLCYFQVYKFGLINFDDGYYVKNHVYVSNGLTWEGFRYAFTSLQMANWHPLTWLSYMLDRQLWDDWYGGYHLVNLGIHLLNAILLFFWLGSLSGRWLAAWFISAFFAVHPQNVESVVWVSERKDVLSVLFGVCSLIFYVKYVKNRRKMDYLYTLCLFACSLMSKSMLVTLPCVFLLLDLWPLGRWSGDGQSNHLRAFWYLVREKSGFWLLSLATSFMAYYAQSSKGATLASSTFSLPIRIANAGQAYLGYLEKMFVPRNLAIFYPHEGTALLLWPGYLAWIAMGALTVFLWSIRKKYGWLSLGWLWFAGTLVPVCGLVQIGAQSMADRYGYFPKIGLLIMVFFSLDHWLKDMAKRLQWAVVCGLGLLWGLVALLCHKQVSYWESDEKLFSHAAKVTRNNVLAWGNWGIALMEQKRMAEAVPLLEEALKIVPEHKEYMFRLSQVLEALGEKQRAKALAKKVIETEPKTIESIKWWFKLELESRGVSEEALGLLQKLERERPDDRHVLELAARVALANEDHAAAFEKLDRLMLGGMKEGHLLKPYMQLAFSLKHWEKAVKAARQLQELGYSDEESFLIPAVIAVRKGQHRMAREVIQSGLEKFPTSARLLSVLLEVSRTPQERERISEKVAIAQFQGGTPYLDLLMAKIELNNGNLSKVDSLLRKIKWYNKVPEMERAKLELRWLIASGELSKTAKLVEKWQQVESLDVEFLLLVSQVCRNRKQDLAQALLCVKKAEEMDFIPNVLSFVEEAMVWDALGNQEKAKNAASDAMACYHDGDSEVRLELAQKLSKWLPLEE